LNSFSSLFNIENQCRAAKVPVIYAKSAAGKRLVSSPTRLTSPNFIDYHAAAQHDFRKTTKSAVQPRTSVQKFPGFRDVAQIRPPATRLLEPRAIPTSLRDTIATRTGIQ
jgi:hypothetical protein